MPIPGSTSPRRIEVLKTYPMISTSATGGPVTAARSFPSAGPPRLGAVGATIRIWLDRSRSRRVLATLDSRQLRDVGLSADDGARECEKPFWQA
jgi:uncharacterized protein YjiS (DUF1127 family)